MGEKQNHPFQISFNASCKVEFEGSRVTSDGGLILVRELDERLGLGDLMAEHLSDSRRGENTQRPLVDLFRQSVYSRITGYEDVKDAKWLSQVSTFRLIGSEKVWDRRAALADRVGAGVERNQVQGGGDGEVSRKSLENEEVPRFPVLGKGRTGHFVDRGSRSGMEA